MELKNASFDRLDSIYQCLKIEIDGRQAIILLPEHGQLFYSGLTFLGPEFEGVVPDILYRTLDGEDKILRGFTRDRRIWKLSKQMMDSGNAGTFTPGPVEIPAE